MEDARDTKMAKGFFMNPSPVAGLVPLISLISTASGDHVALRVISSEAPEGDASSVFSAVGSHPDDALTSQIQELAPPVVSGVLAESSDAIGHRFHGGPPSHCIRCLLDASPYPALAFDLATEEGRVLTANTPFVKEMLPPGVGLPRRLADCFPQDLLRVLHALPEGKTLYFKEVPPPVPNGFIRTYDLHARLHTLPHQQTRPIGLLFFSERTDRRHLQEQLRESEDVRRVLEGTTTEVIIRTTPEGIITYASPASEGLNGYKPEEILGRSAYDFMHPDEVERLVRTHEAILAQGALHVFEHRLRHKDGTWKILETRARAVRHPETGEILEIHTSQRDLTDLKRGKQERELALEAELSALRYAQHSLTHDLNNVFSILLSNHEFLQEAIEGLPPDAVSGAGLEDMRQCAGELHEASKRAAHMIRDHRRTDRDETPAAVDLNVLLKPESLGLLLGSRQNLSVSLTQEPALVAGPAGSLIRMIDNLVVNAREAMSGVEKPRLIVSSEIALVDEAIAESLSEDAYPLPPRAGRFVRIRVRDNGHGMTDQVRRRIFEVGFSTKAGLGAQRGDGMPMVARCLESMGGFATIVSTPGRGTTFEIYLPAVRQGRD